MTQKYQYLFTPLDTWFFREAYPYSVAGARELYSVFPPPARAVMGAIRALIAEHAGIDWDNYQADIEKTGLDKEIGRENSFGKLVLEGPYLRYQGKRLAPAPLFLMQTTASNCLAVLKPGTPVECDLGKKVKLPVLETRGAKSLEHTWLTTDDLRNVLIGHLPTSEKLINAKAKLYNEERHLGIALDHQRYVTKTGQLYETRHLRLLPEVVIEAVVSGISPDLHPAVGKQSVRLGGESRMALVEVKTPPDPSAPPLASVDDQKSDRNILIMLLTSADLGSSWLPAETFKPVETETETVWRGELFGIPLEIISATIGKVLREGGWDIQGRKSRPNKSLIPAGSAWFARVLNNQTVAGAIKVLSGQHIGQDSALGQGEITVGIW